MTDRRLKAHSVLDYHPRHGRLLWFVFEEQNSKLVVLAIASWDHQCQGQLCCVEKVQALEMVLFSGDCGGALQQKKRHVMQQA